MRGSYRARVIDVLIESECIDVYLKRYLLPYVGIKATVAGTFGMNGCRAQTRS